MNKILASHQVMDNNVGKEIRKKDEHQSLKKKKKIKNEIENISKIKLEKNNWH